jgi:hypothetical protein
MTARNIRVADMLGLVVGISLGCALLLLLAGCSNAPIWGSWSKAPTAEQLAAVRSRAETYVYFPNYEVYHQPERDEYTFWDGQAWVTTKRPPPAVTVELLERSPQVELKLHDHPGQERTEPPPGEVTRR